MKRLNPENINEPPYMDKVWANEPFHNYDCVRLGYLLKHIKKDDKVLDIGAGRFGAVEYGKVRTARIPFEAYAIDFSLVAKEMTLAICPEIDYQVHDIRTGVPYPDNTFDCVILGEIIEHWEKPQDLINEAVRVCKKDGWTTLTTVDTECEQAKLRKYPDHVYSFELADLECLFVNAGCSEVHTGLVGNYQTVEARK